MSAALYIVLERDGPEIDSHVDGKALSRNEEALSRLAAELGVTPLMSFFSMSVRDLQADASDLGVEIDVGDAPAEQWFEAADGLRTVRALVSHLEHDQEAVAKPERVLSDLRAFADVLMKADATRIWWHLAVDC